LPTRKKKGKIYPVGIFRFKKEFLMKFSLIISLFALLGGFALASTKDLASVQQGCSDPGSIQNQNPPSEITINCTGNKTVWTQITANPIVLVQTASVTTSITTDKPNVGSSASTTPVLIQNQIAGCPVYIKTSMSGTSSYIVTCEEVMAMTDLQEWCFAKLIEEGAANPNVWTSTQSGETYQPCQNTTPPPASTPTTAF
jgi:hypothetical protein